MSVEEEATGKKRKTRHMPRSMSSELGRHRPSAGSTSVPVPKPSRPSCPAKQDCALQNNDGDGHRRPQWTTCSVQGHVTRRVTPRGGRDRSPYRCSNGDTERFNHVLGVTQPGFKSQDAWLAGQGTEPLSEKTAVATGTLRWPPAVPSPASLLPSPRRLLEASGLRPACAPSFVSGSHEPGAFAG